MDYTLAEFLQQTCVKVDRLSLLINESKTARLNSEAVSNIKVSPDGDSSAVLLVLFNFELATEESEHFCSLRD